MIDLSKLQEERCTWVMRIAAASELRQARADLHRLRVLLDECQHALEFVQSLHDEYGSSLPGVHDRTALIKRIKKG